MKTEDFDEIEIFKDFYKIKKEDRRRKKILLEAEDDSFETFSPNQQALYKNLEAIKDFNNIFTQLELTIFVIQHIETHK